jgi:hypothetical protein
MQLTSEASMTTKNDGKEEKKCEREKNPGVKITLPICIYSGSKNTSDKNIR